MKPDYHVPSMDEIRAVPWNGLTHVSTFSGCGGTCLGFRMAGFRTLWANDWNKHAEASYRLNFPDTIFDSRSIVEVTAADILAATGLKRGELDVGEGSPPCTHYSRAGKGAKNWGRRAKNVRVEKLYLDFVQLIDGLAPRVFPMENVNFAAGASLGYFRDAMRRLRAIGYRVEARELHAKWLGVPQARERLIAIGVREDLGVDPRFPSPLLYRYTVRDVLPYVRDVQNVMYGAKLRSANRPMPTICADSRQRLLFFVDGAWRDATIEELKLVSSFPAKFALDGKEHEQRRRIGNAVPPLMARAIAATIRDLLTEVDRRRVA